MSVSFSPDSMRLLYTFGSNVKGPVGAAVLELSDGRESRRYSQHENSVVSGIFLPDGKRVATGDSESCLRIWDAKTGATLRTLDGRGKTMFSAGWSPDGQAIAWGRSKKDHTTDFGGALDRTFCFGRLSFGPPPDKTFARSKNQLGAFKIGILQVNGVFDLHTLGIGATARSIKISSRRSRMTWCAVTRYCPTARRPSARHSAHTLWTATPD